MKKRDYRSNHILAVLYDLKDNHLTVVVEYKV